MLLDPSDRALFRGIWGLTWPMIVYNVLEMTVGFVDLLMVRSQGPAATAAMGARGYRSFSIPHPVLSTQRRRALG